jgi:uncharacterized sulfatase
MTILLLVVYQVERGLFFLFNFTYFNTMSISDLLVASLHGLRFDLVAVLITNAPLLALLIIPNPIQKRKWFPKFVLFLFMILNIPCILLNSIDLEYFQFQGKRTTADLFDLFFLGSDMQNTIPQMAMDFWQVLVITVILSTCTFWLFKIIIQKTNILNKKHWTFHWIASIIIIPAAIVGARGSTGLKPLRIGNAASVSSPALAPLVLNTPFTIIKTIGSPSLEIRFTMQEEEANKLFQREKSGIGPLKPLNVMVIILESFSSEYSNLISGNKGYTPFLDSLMQEGLYFPNAYANAKKSIDGIPAVISSLPTLMPFSYITSQYSANNISSIPGILGSKGYSSAFFHGGNNGTMGFDIFTKNAGISEYHGRNEYGNGDYDGNWGVFDEPFYDYVITTTSAMKEPFANTVFTLSSHHPYSIPNHLANNFPKGTLAIHESIGYADYALSTFFAKASKTDWYNNTLFVLTADHTGPSETPMFSSRHGVFRIPMAYYHPGKKLKGRSERVTQQTDILPSVLGYLGYDGKWKDFGTSVFEKEQVGFAISYTGDMYQIVRGNNLLQFDGSQVVGFYDLESDPLLKKNIMGSGTKDESELDLLCKAVIWQYTDALQANKINYKR